MMSGTLEHKTPPIEMVRHIMDFYQGTIMNVKCLVETGGGSTMKNVRLYLLTEPLLANK